MHRRILIVEDEASLRRIIARNLTRRGDLVQEAETAEGAVSLLRAGQVDLILLDICLPDRSGWDVLRDMRDRQVSVPTIVISAVRVSPQRLAEFRPLAYLPKPFPLDALLRLVESDDLPASAEAIREPMHSTAGQRADVVGSPEESYR